METVNISIQLLNAIMANLGRQPYEQVFQLVEAIQKEAQKIMSMLNNKFKIIFDAFYNHRILQFIISEKE